MDVALVEHAEQYVDGDDGRQDQEDLVGEGRAERLGGPLEASLDALRQAQLRLGLLDRAHGLAERHVGREVERDRDDRELSLVVHGQGNVGRLDLRERAERHRSAPGRFEVHVLKVGWDSSTTRYWFNCVNMVEICRWPKAS